MTNLPKDDLQQAQELSSMFSHVYRAIPTQEEGWQRGGNLVRIKLIDLEAALPPEMSVQEITNLTVVAYYGGTWHELPTHLDYADGYGRWSGGPLPTADTWLCFHAPAQTVPAPQEWPGAGDYMGQIALTLWDSRAHARLEDLVVYYAVHHRETPAPSSALYLAEDANGWTVLYRGQRCLHFAANHGYQLDWVCPPGEEGNMVPPGFTWRWLLTETVKELARGANDRVTFEPVVREGPVLVIRVEASSPAGQMTATLRILVQNEALVAEFSDYRTIRARPELPPDQHQRSYAGQYASPYPGVHYVAFLLTSDTPGARLYDHLYRYGEVSADGPLSLVYVDERLQTGWNWMALQAGNAVAGLAAHGRSHYPDHPFKAGREAGATLLGLEPFGSEVGGHYHSCDRYMLVLARSVEEIRETFDTLDTFPLLARVPVSRHLTFLETYNCLRKWINLNLDYLMAGDNYRNALRTDGTYLDDTDTCLVAIQEMARLYEKTGWQPFLDTAERAADFVAQWILSGKIASRGKGVGANGGGIYQNELIYLLLGLAHVYRLTNTPGLRQAIDYGLQWMLEQRGGKGTWGWPDYLWHAGGWDAKGQPLYHWPVNTNEFATLNFRLYQLLGDKAFYDQAMTVMEDYFQHIPPDSWEIVRGGGVSDTTRGIHLFAEAIEVAAGDPRVDCQYLATCVDHTLARFWVEGWPLIHHSIYGEAMWPGKYPPEIFGPGFKHWHNCGSHLDIQPRIQIAAKVGVGEHLTRWAMKDLAYDFDARYGLEEHTHLCRYSMRDTDIEPACWLDCELLPTLYAAWKRGWVDSKDLHTMSYKIHQMLQRTFISYDADHGGWASTYDSATGQPIKYLAYWEHRHSHERFAPQEPLEMWGIPTRDVFYDHSTHYWSPLAQLVDDLLRVQETHLKGSAQVVACVPEGLGATVPGPRPLLVPRLPGADSVAVISEAGKAWNVQEARVVRIVGEEFWLVAAE